MENYNELKNAPECGFCGADNYGQYKYIFYHKNNDGYKIICRNCSAETKRFKKLRTAEFAWREGKYTIPVQSEKQIYKGCLSLMQGVVEYFKEYLDFIGIDRLMDDYKEMGIDTDSEEYRFSYNIQPTEIVNRLFLWNTRHSGGTSTRAKCRELGIDDCSRSIEFSFEDE